MQTEWDSDQSTPELPAELNRLSDRVIGAAIEVHRGLGPGLLERLYEDAFVHELTLSGLRADRQVPVTLNYKGLELAGQRIDVIVERVLVVEIKAVESVLDVHIAQLLGYLRAGSFPLGLLPNFTVPVLRKGIYRRINSAAIQSTPRPDPRFNSAASATPLRPLRTS